MFKINTQRQASHVCPSKPLTGAFAAIFSLLALAPEAGAIPLTFDTPVESTDASNLLGPVAARDTMFFLNVATDNGATIDAKVTATVQGDTDFGSSSDPAAPNTFGAAGFLPDYHSASGGPEQDLAFLYYGNGINTDVNGVTFLFEFFEGSGAMSGSFDTSRNVSSLELAIYDVDGESYQSEYFTAYKSDGLSSYALGTSPQALVASDLGDAVRFDGPGTNFSELDATGAVILNYEDTDAFTLAFGSVQNSGPDQNAVFSAIDGDVSLFDLEDFGTPVEVNPVPLPAGALLLLSAFGISAFFKRSRKT